MCCDSIVFFVVIHHMDLSAGKHFLNSEMGSCWLPTGYIAEYRVVHKPAKPRHPTCVHGLPMGFFWLPTGSHRLITCNISHGSLVHKPAEPTHPGLPRTPHRFPQIPYWAPRNHFMQNYSWQDDAQARRADKPHALVDFPLVSADSLSPATLLRTVMLTRSMPQATNKLHKQAMGQLLATQHATSVNRDHRQQWHAIHRRV